jgi:hypothetical protein
MRLKAYPVRVFLPCCKILEGQKDLNILINQRVRGN